MDERIKFIGRILDGEKMAALCREFNISRKTGYKIIKRYNECGLEALTDRSRRPYRHANQLPMQIEKLIVRLKRSIQVGAHRRSGSGSSGFTRKSIAPPYRRFMRCWTDMAWSSAKAATGATNAQALRFPMQTGPTNCGALITRVSSCWQTNDTATR